MTVVLLVDNDIVIKLARMATYVDALTSMGVEPGQVGSLLPMLRYMGIADEHRRVALTATAAEADRLNEALHSIIVIEMSSEEARLAAELMRAILADGLDMQEGELALFVVATCRGATDVSTGDKRAIQSLPKLERLWGSISSLRGRIICLEQLFEMLCRQHGIARVRAAVTASPRADEAISFVYDQTASRGAGSFISGLQLVTKDRVDDPAPGWLKSF